MASPIRVSYAFIVGTLLLVGWLNLATPFLTVLLSYFALTKLNRWEKKWLAIALFLILVAAVFYGFGFFLKRIYEQLPDILYRLVPVANELAGKYGVTLPFKDTATLHAFLGNEVVAQIDDVGSFAKFAAKQAVFILIGLVVAVSLFLNERLDLARDTHLVRNNLYTVSLDHIAERFRTFYRSFATVMGAQIIISAINTSLTSIYVLSVGLPYPRMVLIATFLCGLLPILGNLLSNTLIVGIALTVSPKLAVMSLAFLVVLHKSEYFLNSKIIGQRIQNPMWLTLLGLILGERLMGVPGMILAPVVLHYIKVEASKTAVAQSPGAAGPAFGHPLPSSDEGMRGLG